MTKYNHRDLPEVDQNKSAGVISRNQLTGEVWGDRRGDEGLHGLPMDLLEHEQDLWALGDQFTLTAGVKLMLHLLQERLQQLRLLGQGRLLAHEGDEFVLELVVQASDHHLHGVSDLSHPLILRSPDSLHIPLHFLHQTDELHEAAAEHGNLLLHLCHVMLIDLHQRFEGVAAVHASPQSTLVTDALLTGPTENTQLLKVVVTLVLVVVLMLGEAAELQGVQLLGDLLCPATVDQLPQLEWSPTVWTLGSLLRQPSSYAAEAAEFGTVWAEAGIPQLLHADETAKHLSDALNTLFIHLSQFEVLLSQG